jgi:hypothetical protein
MVIYQLFILRGIKTFVYVKKNIYLCRQKRQINICRFRWQKQVKSNLLVTMEGTNKVIKWYYEQKCPKFQIQLRKTLVVRCLFFFISCFYKIRRRLFIYSCEVYRNSFYTLNKEITIRIIP